MPRFVPIAFAVSLLGLESCQPAPATPRQVRSVGYGHVTVYPDYAELTVDAAFTRPRLKDAVAEVQRVVDQVLTLSNALRAGARRRTRE